MCSRSNQLSDAASSAMPVRAPVPVVGAEQAQVEMRLGARVSVLEASKMRTTPAAISGRPSRQYASISASCRVRTRCRGRDPDRRRLDALGDEHHG